MFPYPFFFKGTIGQYGKKRYMYRDDSGEDDGDEADG
jgi:hypothetical protein